MVFSQIMDRASEKLEVKVFNVDTAVANERWMAIKKAGPFKYKNKALGCALCKKVDVCAQKCPQSTQECTWCPGFCPQAVNATCIPFGQAVTLSQDEDVVFCEMGQKGLSACCCLCPVVYCGGIPPGSPLQFSCAAAALTTVQRERLKKAYAIKDDTPAPGGFFCYPCALWHQHTFLQEMALLGKKGDKLDAPLNPVPQESV